MGPPLKVRPVVPPEASTEVTVPEPPPPIQVPLIAKQPPDRSIPLEKVEVAEVEVILSAPACKPPAKVEVAEVEVALKTAAVGVEVLTILPEELVESS